MALFGIGMAYAGDHVGGGGARLIFDLGVRKEEPKYFIVLAEEKTEEEAGEKAKALGRTVRNVQVIQWENHFLVVLGGGPQERSEALLEAIRLKEVRRDLRPSLLPDR